MAVFLLGENILDIEKNKKTIDMYLKVQSIASIFNKISAKKRSTYGDALKKIDESIPVELGKILYKNNLQNDKQIFTLLIKLLIQCSEEASDKPLSEIKLSVDFNQYDIEEIFDRFKKDIETSPHLYE